mmetsp:Transcript_105965/g.330475  ORF Transcript_105965/g.330475 Transcript_105965/m.330475 type:complete len:366 (+) Transcript_105965:34-1131(+)
MVDGNEIRRGGGTVPQASHLRRAAAAALGSLALLLRSGPRAFSSPGGGLAGLNLCHRVPHAATCRVGRYHRHGQWQAGRRLLLPPLRAAGNAWTMLGVSPGSSRQQIKQAFRERIKKAHPDAGGSAEEFRELQRAYKEALEEAGASPAQTGSTATSGFYGDDAYRPPPEEGHWSIHDFYKWRREEAQTDYERWKKDAYWKENSNEDQKWRQRWAGAEQREQQEQRRHEHWARGEQHERQEPPNEAEQQRVREQAEFKSELRREQASARTQRRQQGERRNRDVHKWDWDAVIDERKADLTGRGARGAKSRPAQNDHSRPLQDGDVLISHRTVETADGPMRVPVFQATSGARYYRSPVTSKRVPLPR